MQQQWTHETLKQYIDDEIEENLNLDYKAAAALGKSDSKKKEITKDISAMANSDGGLIIYGIMEYQDPNRKHLPEKIDPIDRTQFSKEWLEQIINTISPRIDGVVIYPVSISDRANGVVYIVEIPQSSTAHQARDNRYYKRFNFVSAPMQDYEVRDVMGRSQHPKIVLNFEFEIETHQFNNGVAASMSVDKTLIIRAENVGQIYAQYVIAHIAFPAHLLHKDELRYRETFEEDGQSYCWLSGKNTIRDLLDVELSGNRYGPSRFDPILPGLSNKLKSVKLADDFESLVCKSLIAKWDVHADNAQPNSGITLMKDIKIVKRTIEE